MFTTQWQLMDVIFFIIFTIEINSQVRWIFCFWCSAAVSVICFQDHEWFLQSSKVFSSYKHNKKTVRSSAANCSENCYQIYWYISPGCILFFFFFAFRRNSALFFSTNFDTPSQIRKKGQPLVGMHFIPNWNVTEMVESSWFQPHTLIVRIHTAIRFTHCNLP